MFDKYKISVDGNNMLVYTEDDTILADFLVNLLSYYKGMDIEIKKVKHYDDPELHEFLHGFDLEGDDYALLTEQLQVFAQPCFEYFLNSLPYKDSDSCFVDYLKYSETSDFIVDIQDYELSKGDY